VFDNRSVAVDEDDGAAQSRTKYLGEATTGCASRSTRAAAEKADAAGNDNQVDNPASVTPHPAVVATTTASFLNYLWI
jgi:hypothetical protein